jgi:hypothetical protein
MFLLLLVLTAATLASAAVLVEVHLRRPQASVQPAFFSPSGPREGYDFRQGWNFIPPSVFLAERPVRSCSASFLVFRVSRTP